MAIMPRVALVLLFFTQCVRSQDCDTFLCLRIFHDEFIAAAENKTAACRAVEDYVDCVGEATDACTTLGIAELQTAADKIKTHAVCGGTSSTPALIWLITGSILVTVWN